MRYINFFSSRGLSFVTSFRDDKTVGSIGHIIYCMFTGHISHVFVEFFESFFIRNWGGSESYIAKWRKTYFYDFSPLSVKCSSRILNIVSVHRKNSIKLPVINCFEVPVYNFSLCLTSCFTGCSKHCRESSTFMPSSYFSFEHTLQRKTPRRSRKNAKIHRLSNPDDFFNCWSSRKNVRG